MLRKTSSTNAENSSVNAVENSAVKNFREYLQIPSVHPNVNYDACTAFLENQAKSLGVPLRIYYCFPRKPIVILTWIGQEPDLPTILLNSHMDVVPVFEGKWTHQPFDADIDEKGNIYARGTQDTKSVGIQYLEAIRRLKSQNVTLKRTIHVSFMPDEEIGGVEGMRAFSKTKDFLDLNVGFAVDEGMAHPGNEYTVFYGERNIWQMHIHCPGKHGHGSLLLDNTAGEKVRRILNNFFNFRNQQKKKLQDNPSLKVGDVTSINLTQIKGGVQSNVIPPEFVIVFDCRVAITVDLKEFEETLNRWCKEAGEDVWIEYEQREPQVPITNLNDSNPYWTAFKKAADELNLQLKTAICPGVTDSRYVRASGRPAIGFSPMNNTPILVHNHNEYLNVNVFLRGIDIYCKLISAIANVEESAA